MSANIRFFIRDQTLKSLPSIHRLLPCRLSPKEPPPGTSISFPESTPSTVDIHVFSILRHLLDSSTITPSSLSFRSLNNPHWSTPLIPICPSPSPHLQTSIPPQTPLPRRDNVSPSHIPTRNPLPYSTVLIKSAANRLYTHKMIST